jgi:TolB protein
MNVNPGESPDTVDTNMEIFVADADGTNLTQLTQFPGTDTAPRWSPDGTHMAFTRDLGGNAELFVMNADGSDVRRLTTNPGPDGLADWSPDGKTLVYVANVDGQVDLLLISPDGGEPEFFTKSRAVEGTPRWSPDGSTIAYRGDYGTEVIFRPLRSLAPWSVDVARGIDERPERGNFEVRDLAWSPYDRKLVAVMTRPEAGRGSFIIVFEINGDVVTMSDELPDTYGIDWR